MTGALKLHAHFFGDGSEEIVEQLEPCRIGSLFGGALAGYALIVSVLSRFASLVI